MSSLPPNTHPSHLNTYSHGPSTIPAGTGSRTKGPNSSASSSVTSSVQNSARREHDVGVDGARLGEELSIMRVDGTRRGSGKIDGRSGAFVVGDHERSSSGVVGGGVDSRRPSKTNSAAGSEHGSERGSVSGSSREKERVSSSKSSTAIGREETASRSVGGRENDRVPSSAIGSTNLDRSNAPSDRARDPERSRRVDGSPVTQERIGVPSALQQEQLYRQRGRASSNEANSIAAAAAESTSGRTSTAVPTPTKPKSTKPPRALSKKKQKLLNEQTALSEVASHAAELLAEKRELEAKIAAREEQARKEGLHQERVNEASRLYTEAESDEVFNRERENVLVKLEEQIYEAQEWDAYLACNPLPDVTVPSALNSYVSMFRENDSTNLPNLVLKPALEACNTTEQVVAELKKRLATAQEENIESVITTCDRYIYLLRELSAAKLVDVTCRFLHLSDVYEQGEECAFTQCAATESVQYGLWVHNSSRTARIKRIEFTQMGVTIELPQSLQKARTAILAIRTLYDHASVTKTTPKAQTSGAALLPSSSTASLSGRPSTRGEPKAISGLPSDFTDASEEAFTDPTSLFDFDLRPPPSDSRAHFVSLGGVLDLQQLLLPAPAKKIRSWVMREMTPLEKQLVTVPYPLEDANGQSSVGSAQSAPLRLKYTLPTHIFLNDREPIFGYWDSAASKGRGAWVQDGINILSFDPRSRLVSLSVPTIKPIAVIQPRALDYPYRSWSIMPVREADQYAEPSLDDDGHTCRLEVTVSRFSVCFELRGLLARLYSPAHPFLARFREEWSTPGELMAGLKEVGIHITPSDADAAYCRKPLKSSLLEQTLHSHLALLTQVFDVTSSSHNVSRSSTAATLRIRLNRTSTLLASAAQKRSIMDWEAQAEEDERLDKPDESYKNFPDALREQDTADAAEKKQAADDLEAQIAVMEAEERKAEADAEAKRVREAEALSRSSSATSKTLKKKESKAVAFVEPETTPRPPEPPALTQEQKYALGFEWVTVLAELIDAPSDPTLASAAAAASNPSHAFPTSGRTLTAVERAQGSLHENLPTGVLLKFTLIRGDQPDGSCDLTPLPDQVSHFSLRRCLLTYFIDKTPHDLTTAMSMAQPKTAAATVNGLPQFHFIPFDSITLQTQQTVRRTLNLLRPFVFC